MHTENPYWLEPRKTRLGFERAASTYDASAFLQREIGNRLTGRLDWLLIEPMTVLDIGCGTGAISAELLRRYPAAQVIGVDLALGMVQQTCRHASPPADLQGICADAAALPFRPQTADLLVSSLMLQWCNDLPGVFREFVQVLKPHGALMFATFGPDTLQELRASWSQVDGYTHASRFPDMHDVADALMQAGFRDPVVDRETVTLTYRDVRELLRDLKGIGASNATAGRNRGLTGKSRLVRFLEAYAPFRQADGLYPATYEVVYGHAWAPALLPGAYPANYIPIHPVKR